MNIISFLANQNNSQARGRRASYQDHNAEQGLNVPEPDHEPKPEPHWVPDQELMPEDAKDWEWDTIMIEFPQQPSW